MSLGPLVDSSSGLPAWIGMHHGQISAVPTLPFAPKTYRTVPNTHTNTPTARSSVTAFAPSPPTLASQPCSHYQAHSSSDPRTCPSAQYAPAGRSSVSSAAESTILAPMITLRSNFCVIAKVYEKQLAPAPK